MLRLGAIAIILLPLVVGLTLGDRVWGAWLGAGLALGGGLALATARPRSRSLIVLGTLLAAVVGLSAPRLSSADDLVVLDLRHDPVPELQGPARITGFMRPQWALAEHLDPSESPTGEELTIAHRVPMLGATSEPSLPNTMLVVRLPPDASPMAGLQIHQGRARLLEDDSLAPFIEVSGLDAPDSLRGILLDTFEPIDTAPAWLRGMLMTLELLGAFACLWIATRPREPGTQPQ